MRSTKAVIGIVMVLVLALSALGAASASAADRAWTCEPAPAATAQFKDAHCVTAQTGKEGFKHTLITASEGAKTHIWASSEKTAEETKAASLQVLQGNLAGVAVTIKCTGVTGTGKLWNSATAAFGSGKLLYTGCTVTAPANKGCEVVGGIIETTALVGTTSGTTGTRVKISPFSGSILAPVTIAGCEKEHPPADTYKVEGSVEAPTNGATFVATESTITTEGTLLFGGNAAGLEGAVTLTMKDETTGTLGNAITLTP